MKGLVLLLGVLLIGTAAFGQDESAEPGEPAGALEQVVLETNQGPIVLEIDLKNAPISGKSFLANVDAGTYDGTIFHRVIPNFMIQGGGFMPAMKPIETDKKVRNEADNGLKNLRGTVAMARRRDPDSASIQFFINVVDNVALDHTSKSVEGWGYAVFARVVEGMEVADAISKVPRGRSGAYGDVPEEPVVIESASRRPQQVSPPSPATEE